MLVEIKREASNFGNAYGHRIYVDGEDHGWHYGPSDRTTISMMTRHIQAHSKEGGTIIDYDVFGSKKPKKIQVAGCPTGHKNIRDDFMGGLVCLDCKAVW